MRPGLANALAAALTLVAAVGYAAASIFRHARFSSNAYDLGIFDQSVWAFSRLELAMDNTVRVTPTPFIDHFQPALLALAPLYAIHSDPRVLLVVQALLVALASLPLYVWARRELGAAAALAVQACYLGFWAVLAGVLYDFHDTALGAPVVALGLFALLDGRRRLLWASAVAAALVREDLPLTFAAIGVYLALADRERRREGAALAVLSLAYVAVATNVIIPALAGSGYEHWSYYPTLGHALAHPLATLELLVTPAAKLTAVFNLFAAWLFLPLASPVVAIAIPGLLERFFSSKPAHWQQGFHYSLTLAPILGFATAHALRRFGRRAPILALALLASGAFFTLYRMKPLDELTRYAAAERAAEIRACLATIPAGASVTATSALVPHLSERRQIRLLDRPRAPDTRYLAVDTSTWIFPLSRAGAGRAVRAARATGYRTRCVRGPTVVLERQ